VAVPPLKPLYILQAIVTPNILLLRTAQFEECPLLPVRELELQKKQDGQNAGSNKSQQTRVSSSVGGADHAED
jgi:hypothetical protein